MAKNRISWALRLLAAAILLQTLYFKFTAAPESVEIFTILGMEPHGRIFIGVFELITAILLIIPRSTAHGALLGAGIMSGAVLGHITKLGFSGPMFSLGLLAILVLVCCLIVLFLHRNQLPFRRFLFLPQNP
ncbi:DoxX family protein [Puniceicoccales bacterium CK1056]|uniref:DoxX family protein n=1 Tax=Oceanipulchritudo coccoides TaxID=2706888 RepID=A0A6B2M253_9BACT|nr:DoxX family protein [Oceanipulchritudo coccoides]NDV62412.1 DoxX family protein [Oceanipulchritudo coccoides]